MLEDFVGTEFCHPHALTHGNYRIWIRENTLELSSLVLTAQEREFKSQKLILCLLSKISVELLCLNTIFLVCVVTDNKSCFIRVRSL